MTSFFLKKRESLGIIHVPVYVSGVKNVTYMPLQENEENLTTVMHRFALKLPGYHGFSSVACL